MRPLGLQGILCGKPVNTSASDKADHGQVDVLANNAGVAVFEMAADVTEDAFHKQFNINVLGYFLAIPGNSQAFWRKRRQHHQHQHDPQRRPLPRLQHLCRDQRCRRYDDIRARP